jgi:hypothetical protein
MRPNRSFIALFLVIFTWSVPQVLAQNESGISLIKAIERLEQTFDLRFSYSKTDLEGVMVDYKDLETLEEELDSFESQTAFVFNRISDRYYSIVKKDDGFRCGRLVASDSGLALSEAIVRTADNSFSAITNENGYFHLPESVAQNTLEIRYLGYETMTLSPDELNKDCPNILMQTTLSKLNTVFVKSFLVPGLNQQTDGSVSINTDRFGLLPGQVENDVLQIAQAIPGVQSVNESISNINIRGGTNDENLILWNGIKMYQNGHFFGLISAFNPDITRAVKVYKNATPAPYGDGVSGSILMSSTQDVARKITARAGINLLNANAYVAIPVATNASLELAGRRSINDLWETNVYRSFANKAFQDSEITNSQASSGLELATEEDFGFYDFSARFLWDPSARDKVHVNFLMLSNQIDLTEALVETTFSENNNLEQNSRAVGLTWERKWNDKWRTSFVGYGSSYALNALNRDIQSLQEVIQENEVLETSATFSVNYRLSYQWTLNSGYQFLETGITNTQDVNLPRFRDFEKDVIRTHAGFAGVSYSSDDQRTQFSGAVRVNYFDKLSKLRLEPRLSVIQELINGLSIELLGEMKSQATSQRIDFNSDFLGLENRRWILADGEDIPLKESAQASLGLVYDHNNWLLSASAFIKEVEGITASNQGFQNQFQFVRATGSYSATGAEFVANHRASRYSIWLSYAYLDNQYDFPDLVPPSFPHNLDITHSVNLAGTYYSGPFKVAAGVNWRTGKPFTIPVEGDAIAINGAESSINFDQPNEQRLEDYLRLDASAEYKLEFANGLSTTINLSVLNILDQQNTLNRRYVLSAGQGGQPILNQIDAFSLGITPNVALRVYF